MIWKEEEISRIRAVQMDKIRSLLGIRVMDRVLNARITEFCGLAKGVDEKTEEDVRRWSSHVERMENERTARRVYVGLCAGSHSVGIPRKRWIDTVKDCLKKGNLDVRQARRMVHDRNVWLGFVRGNAWADTRGMNP